jgi:hypothetical protein
VFCEARQGKSFREVLEDQWQGKEEVNSVREICRQLKEILDVVQSKSIPINV